MSSLGDPSDRPRSSSGQSSSSWAVRCPCCETTLQVDRETGALLQVSPKRAPKKDFESLLAEVDAQRERAEQLFEQEHRGLEQRQRQLDERFRTALEAVEHEADDEPQRPPHPLDF